MICCRPPLHNSTLDNFDPLDHIAARHFVYCLHPRDHLAEDRVATIQMWLWRMAKKELAATGVFARERHADRSALIKMLIDLAADLIAGSAVAIAARVAALHNEVRHDAMEHDAIEVFPLR